MGFIYKITNLKTGKMYVGQTKVSIKRRWEEHQSSARTNKENSMLYRAMRKYGINNFKIEEIEKCDNLIINSREKYWIKELGTFGNGYNMNEGGDYLNTPKISMAEQVEWWKRFESGESLTDIWKSTPYSFATVQKYLSQHRGYKAIAKRNRHRGMKEENSFIRKTQYENSLKPHNVDEFLENIDKNHIDYPMLKFYFLSNRSVNEYINMTVIQAKNLELNDEDRNLLNEYIQILGLKDSDKLFNVQRYTLISKIKKYKLAQ